MASKIFVVTHESIDVPQGDVFAPIAVGGADLGEGFLHDDVGENISTLNPIYNEMTALYWVYKHLDEFPGLGHIGFCHYRRLFCFQNFAKPVFIRKRNKPEWTGTTQKNLDGYWKEFDGVIPYPNYVKSVTHHYEKAHNKEDLPLLLRIIEERFPEYLGAAKTYLEGDEEYLYNMFILKREDFVAYGDFVFPVLEEFYEKRTYKNDRLFVSERLTGIFIRYLLDKHEHMLMCPLLFIRSRSLKAAFKETQKNFKEHPEHGFLFKTKPLWLTLLPRFLEQRLRNRTRIS